jgi:glutaredoxin-related protein
VFIDGKLIGGCDIVHEMHERGELEPLLEKS